MPDTRACLHELQRCVSVLLRPQKGFAECGARSLVHQRLGLAAGQLILAPRSTRTVDGQNIYGADMATGLEGDLANYPTLDPMAAKTFAEANASSAV